MQQSYYHHNQLYCYYHKLSIVISLQHRTDSCAHDCNEGRHRPLFALAHARRQTPLGCPPGVRRTRGARGCDLCLAKAAKDECFVCAPLPYHATPRRAVPRRAACDSLAIASMAIVGHEEGRPRERSACSAVRCCAM